MDQELDAVNQAKQTPGAHLIIGPEGWLLFYARNKMRMGCDNETVDRCRAAGIPTIDASKINLEVLDFIERIAPTVAVGCEPDNPPYDMMDFPFILVPLEYVADIYRVAGAKTYNIKPYYVVESKYKKTITPG